MGWNTTVVVLNDALNDIENDPEFGKKLVRAIHDVAVNRDRIDVSAGSHVNAAHVVESHYADQTSVVAVGGNLGRVVAQLYGWRFETTEEIFRKLADTLGYSVRKKK
jgi:hypothetical protein